METSEVLDLLRESGALLEGGLAAALLLSGGLTSLQAGSLMTALPFSVILR